MTQFKLRIVLGVGILLIVGCDAKRSRVETPAKDEEEETFGFSSASPPIGDLIALDRSTVENPAKLSIGRVELRHAEAKKMIAGMPVVELSGDQPDAIRKRFVALLTDPTCTVLTQRDPVKFRPLIGFVARSKDRDVAGVLGLALNDADENVVLHLDGKKPYVSFHRGANGRRHPSDELIKLAKEIFPNDVGMGALVIPPRGLRAALGGHVVQIIENAKTVECFRIGRQPISGEEPLLPKDAPMLLRYPVKQQVADQKDDFARALSSTLFDPDTYASNTRVMCFEPGVAFRFASDNEQVIVLICFHCHNLSIFHAIPDGSAKELVNELVLERTGWIALVRLAKQAFPDDEGLQGLKEKSKE